MNEKKKDPVDQVEKEKYTSKLKHIEEHYDEHLDEILPGYLHRGDIVSTNRLLGYADAIMATCATFLVIPLRNLKEMKHDEHITGNKTSVTLSHHLDENKTEFVMYFLGFLVVLTIWESLNIRAIFVKRVDDFIIFFALLTMLGATALPFSLALQGHYPDESASVIITCALLAFIEIVEIITVAYAIETPRVLHSAMHRWPVSDRRQFRNIVCLKSITNLVIIIAGGLFTLLDYRISWVLLSLLILVPVFRKLFLYTRRRLATQRKMDKCAFFYHFSKGNISKERVEAMTDAAVAIVACILILDITVEDFPKKKNVKLHGLNYELKHMEKEFYAFLATFAVVSNLWYVNHTVLHLFHTVNVVILYLQKIFLVFACLSPLAGNMINAFATDENDDAKLSVRMSALIVFFSSLANFMILIYGLYGREKFLHRWAIRGCWRVNMRQHLYVVVKAANLPVWTLICALGTLGSASAVEYVLYVCFTGLNVTFFFAKLVFMNHVGKGVYNSETDPREKHFSSKNLAASNENIDGGVKTTEDDSNGYNTSF